MHITLTHPFLTRAHDLPALLDDCNKMSTFINRLEKQSAQYPDRYDSNKYKGDGFELFVEALLKLNPVNSQLGIGEYQIITEGDIGVDGIGVGVNGNPACVQVKFRSKTNDVLTANGDHIINFSNAAAYKYGISVDETKANRLVITTADGLHHFTDGEMLQDKVRCLGYKELRLLVDNNVLFWNGFRKLALGG